MKIQLREHDPIWAEQSGALKAALMDALGARALGLEHVGSTSVPGLCAKPVLDLLLIVEDSAEEGAYVTDVEACGYTLRHREPEWFEHRMFKRSDPDVNLHVFSAGCAEVERMTAFRDLLRRDEAARSYYASEKRRLAELDWQPTENIDLAYWTRLIEYTGLKG